MPPALLPALALLAATGVATFSDASFRLALPLLPAVWVVAAIAWRHRAAKCTIALTIVGFGLCGLVLAAHAREHAVHPSLRTVLDAHVGGFLIEQPGPEADHDPLLIRARLVEDAAVRDDYVSMRANVVEVDGTPAAGGVAFAISGDEAIRRAAEWRAGRTIEARATFRRPARYLNDGVPDLERQVALAGTALFGSIKSGLLVDVVSRGTAFEEWGGTVRSHVRTAIRRWVTPRDATAAAIVTAVLIGDRTGLPDDVTDRLQRAGTYHVIAISGGNVAILAGLVLGLLTLAGVRGRMRAVTAIVALLVYAQIATAGPSVWRATTMAIVYLAARTLDQRTTSWQATALTASVMAVMTPLDVINPGFLLTFGATCALIEGVRWIDWQTATRWTGAGRVGDWVVASVAASVAVELVLIPVSATSFSRVTLAGPLLNLAAVPLMAVAQVAGMFVVGVDGWPALAASAGWLAAAAASAIVSSAGFVDAVPGLSWRVPAPPVAVLVLYYAALLAAVFMVNRRPRLLAIAVMTLVLLVVVGVIRRPDVPAVAGMRLTVMDVGQGEALVLESGANRLQIDAGGAPFGGGAFDIGARVVAPSLWARGIRHLDALLITHGDPDHMGGARVLLDDFSPRQLWEGIVVPRHESSADLRRRAGEARIQVLARRAGEQFTLGNARVRVLHPPAPDWERPRVRNDDSVVLEVTCGDVALLLTGDISAEVEREIAPHLAPARIRILKVGHHGSRTSTSSALLESWTPQIALLSAGRGNTFGHPTPEVLERLASAGARVYRTDRDGQITVETDAECREVFVRTFNGRERR